MKLNKNYFCLGNGHHVCMKCGTSISRLVNGKLRALDNKAHILVSKASQGLYVFNMCLDCAKQLDFKDQQLLDNIHENIVKCREQEETRQGLSPAQIEQNTIKQNQDKPVAGFSYVEESIMERAKALELYAKYLKKQGN